MVAMLNKTLTPDASEREYKMEQDQKPIRLKKTRKVVGLDFCISVLLHKLINEFGLPLGLPNTFSMPQIFSVGFDAIMDKKNSFFNTSEMAEIQLKIYPAGNKKTCVNAKLITVRKPTLNGSYQLTWLPIEGEIVANGIKFPFNVVHPSAHSYSMNYTIKYVLGT